MEYDTFLSLGITSSQKPNGQWLFMECNDKIYMVTQSDVNSIVVSEDEGTSWSIVHTATYEIRSLYYDQSNLNLYWIAGDTFKDTTTEFEAGYISCQSDVNNALATFTDNEGYVQVNDIFLIGSNIYAHASWNNGVAQSDINDIRFGFLQYNQSAANFLAAQSAYNVIGNVQWISVLRSTYVVVDQNNTTVYYALSQATGAGPTYTTYVYSWIEGGGAPTTVKSLTADQHWVTSVITQTLRGMGWDGDDYLYFVANDGVDYNLQRVSIAASTWTEFDEWKIQIMKDNQAGSELEKAFAYQGGGQSDWNIYQLHPNLSFQSNMIAKPDSDAYFIAISNTYLINDDGDMFKWQDASQYIFEMNFIHIDMDIPKQGYMRIIRDKIAIESGMFIKIYDQMISAGQSDANAVIFEGYVVDYSEEELQDVYINSYAAEIDEIYPEGTYSETSTQSLINALVSDYCNYITIGTLSAGNTIGPITFYKDLSLREILNKFCLVDKFIWYLTPTGQLYYNNGTVDTTINISESSTIWGTFKSKPRTEVNYVVIDGAIVSGAQVSGDAQEDKSSQRKIGYRKYERTLSFLQNQSDCNTAATNILSRWLTAPTVVEFYHYDTSIGMMQPGQTITFQYSGLDPEIASGQFGIRSVDYDARQGIAKYQISDIII